MSNKYDKLKKFITENEIIGEYADRNIELDMELRIKNTISHHAKTIEFMKHLEAFDSADYVDNQMPSTYLYVLDAFFELQDARGAQMAKESYNKALDNLKKNV